jgi:succinate-semialdehyde dehydrogenase/glutarate-semialdehyde dehydrogenase
MFKSINPYNQSLIAEFPLYDDYAIQKKLTQASTAFKNWKNESFADRATRMLRASKILLQHKDKYARIITLEMGKPIGEALAEVEKCAGTCDYYAQHAEQFLCDDAITTEAKRSFIHYQPVGAVFAIMPWNFPLWQVFRFAAPSIMAGNVGLLKHAPNVSQTSLVIVEIFKEAGFRAGRLQWWRVKERFLVLIRLLIHAGLFMIVKSCQIKYVHMHPIIAPTVTSIKKCCNK